MSTLSQRDSTDPIEILLVEDNPGDIRLLREAFGATDSETEIRTLTDGDDAVEFFAQHGVEKSPSLPDLVILDLDLPGTDGCGVLEAIRDNPQLKRLPVIILTSSDDNGDIARCYDAHANAYLTKPAGIEEFISLAELIERFWFEQAHHPEISQ